jgi:hypothetical protein
LLRWQKKRGILRSVKDPKHGRFDLWGDCSLKIAFAIRQGNGEIVR